MVAANALGSWAPPPPILRPRLAVGGGPVFRRASLKIPCCSSALSVRPTMQTSTHLEKTRIVACSIGKNLEEESSKQEASFDIKLPRRNLIVQFTCNGCGERSQRTVNRLAYERGTVFVQCAACLVNHKLVDNLDLVIEYNLREEKDKDNYENDLV